MDVVHYLDVEPSISLETLTAVSPIIGHELESRKSLRKSQDLALGHEIALESAQWLPQSQLQKNFFVAPLDILVEKVHGKAKFHIIEVNGSGIGGLTNVSSITLRSILKSFSEIPQMLECENPLILVASSGKEDEKNPRLNKLIYEKILYAEAMSKGFEKRGQDCQILTSGHKNFSSRLDSARPNVVIGYMKDFLRNLKVDKNGLLWLGSKQVNGIVNDRFAVNIKTYFENQVDFSRLFVCNQTYMSGADKGIAYRLYNKFFGNAPLPQFPSRIDFSHAKNRSELVEEGLRRARLGKPFLIKPHGTGLGHGIEFFLEGQMDTESILKKIDRSISATQEFYGLPGGAFPYTVCPFVDADTIKSPDRGFKNNKYELRVVAYRHKREVRVFPSIVKISPFEYNPMNPRHESLINNVTAAATATQKAGSNYVLPLCHPETWKLIGLTQEDIAALCRGTAVFIKQTIEELYQYPEHFDLNQKISTQNSRRVLDIANYF